MKKNIRNNIRKNFQGINNNDLYGVVSGSIGYEDNMTLNNLGLFFEILWENCDENTKQYIINTIEKGI